MCRSRNRHGRTATTIKRMYNNLDTNNRVYLIFCDISTYRHWVNESAKADVFFSNLDKLKSSLTELSEINCYYRSPTPMEQLEEIIRDEQKIIQNFLSRAWISVVSDVKKLKTDKARRAKISKFFDSLTPYHSRFSNKTLKMINEAKESTPDYTLTKTTKAEKDLFFLCSTEKALAIHDSIIDAFPYSQGNYAWFYNNRTIFFDIIGNDIPDCVLIDIIKLSLSDYNYNNAARFIKLKYHFNREYAISIYVAANSMIHNKGRIKELEQMCEYYKISTHSSPCPICKKKSGSIYSFSEAIIGKNYPPFCRHGCSHVTPFYK